MPNSTPSIESQLVVVRRVTDLTPAVREEFEVLEQIWPGDEQGDWILNDQPHDAAVTDELMANTTGFGVADPNMNILAVFDGRNSLVAAEKARAGAKVKLHFEVEGLNETDDFDTEDEEDPTE